MRVESLDAGCGLTRIVEFTIVIVFDDPSLFTGRPIYQCEAAVQAEFRSGWKLMGRRQKDRFSFLRVINELFHHDTLMVHTNRHAFQFGGVERFACAMISWILNEDSVPGIE